MRVRRAFVFPSALLLATRTSRFSPRGGKGRKAWRSGAVLLQRVARWCYMPGQTRAVAWEVALNTEELVCVSTLSLLTVKYPGATCPDLCAGLVGSADASWKLNFHKGFKCFSRIFTGGLSLARPLSLLQREATCPCGKACRTVLKPRTESWASSTGCSWAVPSLPACLLGRLGVTS